MVYDVHHAVHLCDDLIHPVAYLVSPQFPATIQGDEHVFCHASHPHQRLVEFVGNAGGHFAQRTQAVRTQRQSALGLKFPVEARVFQGYGDLVQ